MDILLFHYLGLQTRQIFTEYGIFILERSSNIALILQVCPVFGEVRLDIVKHVENKRLIVVYPGLGAELSKSNLVVVKHLLVTFLVYHG